MQEKLLKGQVDWGGFFAPDLDGTYVSKDPTHNHYWMSPVAVTMMYLNLTKAPFNDVAVCHQRGDRSPADRHAVHLA